MQTLLEDRYDWEIDPQTLAAFNSLPQPFNSAYNATYIVAWPELRIVKAGLTSRRRWKVFQYRGARVVDINLHADIVEAIDHETALDDYFACHGVNPWPTRQEAKATLGKGGGGFLECYRLHESLSLREVLNNRPRAIAEQMRML